MDVSKCVVGAAAIFAVFCSHASCMAMGQAAGVAAALAARQDCDPRNVGIDGIKKALEGIGAIVPRPGSNVIPNR